MAVNSTSVELYYNNSLLQELNDSRMEFNIPIIIYLFIVMIVGFLGNVLVIMIYSFCSPRTSANHYILVLAIVDLINCCFCLPFQISDLWNPYVNAMPILCKIDRVLENTTNLFSGFVLVSVAAERYSKICHPLEPYELSRAKNISIVNIFMTVSLAWPQSVLNGKRTLKIGKHQVVGEDCSYSDVFKGSIYVFLFNGLLYFVYLLALCAFIFFYTNILLVIIKRKRQMRYTESSNLSTKLKNTAKSCLTKCGSVNGRVKMKSSKTTMCLTTVTVTAALSYTPFLTIMTLKTSGLYLQSTLTPSGEYYHYGSSQTVDMVCSLLVKSYFLNSAVNPIIYSILNPTFRTRTKTAFKQIGSKITILFAKKE